jgi:hypothetical protein
MTKEAAADVIWQLLSELAKPVPVTVTRVAAVATGAVIGGKPVDWSNVTAAVTANGICAESPLLPVTFTR